MQPRYTAGVQGALDLDGDAEPEFEQNRPLAPVPSAEAATDLGANHHPWDAQLAQTVASYPWPQLLAQVQSNGWGLLPGLLQPAQCQALASLYGEGAYFRSRIVMQRHAFGRGEYQYFAYPLPAVVQALRTALYQRLLPVANQWRSHLQPGSAPWPATHAAFAAQCHAAGQLRPTPLLLRYREGDYNCLHQDLYGEQVFPLQVVVLLSAPGRDFAGGELVLTEQRPRMQSRVQVLPLQQGDAAIIAVHKRPQAGSRGLYTVQHRHGVSTVLRGERHTLGVVFHDAE